MKYVVESFCHLLLHLHPWITSINVISSVTSKIMQEFIYRYVFPDIKPSLKVNSNIYNFTLCLRISYVTNASESCVTLYKTSAFYLFP